MGPTYQAYYPKIDQMVRKKLDFEAVWIKNKKVVAVTPRPEFKPFFDLQYEGLSEDVTHWRPRRDSNP
jgi:hypothetical protein